MKASCLQHTYTHTNKFGTQWHVVQVNDEQLEDANDGLGGEPEALDSNFDLVDGSQEVLAESPFKRSPPPLGDHGKTVMLKVKKSRNRGKKGKSSSRTSDHQDSEVGLKSDLEISPVKESPEKSPRESDASLCGGAGASPPPVPLSKQQRRRWRQKQRKETSLDRASMGSAGNSEVLRDNSAT